MRRRTPTIYVGNASMYCASCNRVTTFRVVVTKKTREYRALCQRPRIVATAYGAQNVVCGAKIEERTRLAVAAARARLNPKESEL